MSKDMKLIMERWDKFVIEEQQAPQITWRQLSYLIDFVRDEKEGKDTEERKKQLLKIARGQGLKLGLSLIPGLGPLIQAGMDSAEVIQNMVKVYSTADDSRTKTNPFLDLFNLDDGFEDLIDDRLEDKFVEKMINDLPTHIQNNPDQVVPDFDNVIKAWLPTLDLSGTRGNNVTKQSQS